MTTKPNTVLAEYDVDVQVVGTHTIRVRAQGACEAIEAAQKTVKMDDGTILFYKAVGLRAVGLRKVRGG